MVLCYSVSLSYQIIPFSAFFTQIACTTHKTKMHLLINCWFYFLQEQWIVELLSQDLLFPSPLSQASLYIQHVLLWSTNHLICLRSDGHSSSITLHTLFLAPPTQKISTNWMALREKPEKWLKDGGTDLWGKMKTWNLYSLAK